MGKNFFKIKSSRRGIVIFFLIFNLISSELLSTGIQNKSIPDEYSAKNIYNFTSYLISNNEYYRAYVELKRLKSYYPDYLSPVCFHASENYLLFNGEQYKHIINKKDYPNDPGLVKSINLVYKCDAYLTLKNYNDSFSLLSSWHYDNDIFFKHIFLKRQIITYIMMNKFTEVEALLKEYKGENYSKYRELLMFAKERSVDYKKPVLAAVLGIVPGMGYVYSGDYATGIIALLVISLTAFFSYYAFQKDSKPIGIFVGAVGTFFYSGSIIGGYLSANRKNMQLMEGTHNYLIDEANLEEDRNNIFNKYGIQKNARE